MKALISLLAIAALSACTLIVNSEDVRIEQATEIPEISVNEKEVQ